MSLSEDEPTHESNKGKIPHIYTREILIQYRGNKLSNVRPECLDSVFDKSSGCWDPEKWIQDKKRGDTPPADIEVKRSWTTDVGSEGVKRRAADPREKLKEEQDGIILSPQRRSFGSGCHITQQSQGRRADSPTDSNEKEVHREPLQRRVGSGRIITRDREIGNRDKERERDREREREYGYHSKHRDRYEREREERYERRYQRDYEHDRITDRRFDRRRISGAGGRQEEEPEWFSGGPTSQHDTIELHGFDDIPDSNQQTNDDTSPEPEWSEGRSPDSTSPELQSEEKKTADSETLVVPEVQLEEALTVEDSNAAHRVDGGDQQMFNLDDILNSDSFMGLFANDAPSEGVTGSKFSQFFRRETPPPILLPGSHSGSRRSSIQEELLGNMVNEITGPNIRIPSPTESNTYFKPISPAANTALQTDSMKSRELLNLLQSQQKEGAETHPPAPTMKDLNLSRGKVMSVQELEADLKQMVMGRRDTEKITNGPATTQPDEDLSAFKKLLSQVSDGKIIPASKKKTPVVSQMMSRHEQNVLRPAPIQPTNTAPTEQEVLAGLIKNQLSAQASAKMSLPSGTRTQRSGVQGTHITPEILMQIHKLEQQQRQKVQQQKLELLNQMLPPGQQSNFPTDLQRDIRDTALNVELLQRPEAQAILKGLSEGQLTLQHILQQLQNTALQKRQREILVNILKLQVLHSQQRSLNANQLSVPPPAPRTSSPAAPPPPPPPPSVPILKPPPSVPTAAVPPPTIKSRNVSPHHDAMQQVLLQQQARIPSPIGVFPPQAGASPIMQASLGANMNLPTHSVSPNTLSVQPPGLPHRVPSPQELAVHTQQILQNALIKRKLEEQKENYRKRLEMQRSKSPNISLAGSTATKPNESKQVSSSVVSPTSLVFTPTVVMRKMTADKEGTKENKHEVPGYQSIHFSKESETSRPSGAKFSIGQSIPTSLQSSGSMITAPISPRPLHGQRQQQGRPIVKSVQPVVQVSTSHVNDLALKLMEQQQQMSRTSPLPPHSTNFTFPPTGAPPPVPGINMHIPPPRPNMMLRNVPPVVNPATAHAQAIQLATLQARSMDPRQVQRNMQFQNLMNRQDGSCGLPHQLSQPLPNQRGPSPTNNLARWFTPDVLAQASAGNVPELPVLTAQKVLSLEEVERQQQAAAVRN